MSNNTFGNIFTITSFGESHGPAVGGIIDGVPAGMPLDIDEIQRQLNRRRPGQSAIVTPRDEKDKVRILSGIFEGRTTGQPVGFIVENADQHSSDYDNIRDIFRPSHADYTYTAKYGLRDHRGGGRSSARETISRVVAGAVARQALLTKGITVTAYTSAVGDISLDKKYTDLDLSLIDTNDVRCPDPAVAERMHQLIAQVKSEGDTVGGIITCVIKGCPVARRPRLRKTAGTPCRSHAFNQRGKRLRLRHGLRRLHLSRFSDARRIRLRQRSHIHAHQQFRWHTGRHIQRS